jgi:DNA-binding transcriptional LysR family regulator
VDIRQLEFFLTIARLGGFRRAALELNLSQPTLSEKIKQLEQELRVPLFERSTRHLALTVAGQALFGRADRILREMRAAREEMEEFADLARGYVAVGVQAPSGSFQWIPPLLAAFTERYAHVHLTLFERTHQQLLESLHNGEFHVAWLLVPDGSEHDPAGLILHRLYSRELVLVVPAGHRLAHETSITLDQLADEPLILPRLGEPTRTVLDKAFQTKGVEPSIRCEVTDPVTLIGLAAAGLGIAISSETVVRRSGADVITLKLEGVHMVYAVALGWTDRGVRTKAVAAFVEFARMWSADSHPDGIRC